MAEGYALSGAYFLSLVVYLYLSHRRRDLRPLPAALRNQTTNIETLISAPGERRISGTRLPSPRLCFLSPLVARAGLPDLLSAQLLDKRPV